jgi:hypothetical protein
MDCTRCRSRLPDLLHGELEPDVEVAMEHHLGSCPSCRDARAELQRTLEMLEAWGPVESSGDLTLRLSLAMREARSVGWRRRLLPWAAGLAAGLALAAGVLLVGAEVQLSGGRLVVAFGRSDMGTPLQAEQPTVSRLRAEVSRDRRLTLEALEGQLQEWRADEARRWRSLVRALDTVRADDQLRIAEAMDAMGRDAAETRDMLDGVMRLVALETTPSPLERTERVP